MKEASIDEANALINSNGSSVLINFDEAIANHGEMHTKHNSKIYNDIVTKKDSITMLDNSLHDLVANCKDQEFVNLHDLITKYSMNKNENEEDINVMNDTLQLSRSTYNLDLIAKELLHPFLDLSYDSIMEQEELVVNLEILNTFDSLLNAPKSLFDGDTINNKL